MEVFFRGYGLQIIMVIMYLGVFVGMEASKSWLLNEKVDGWQDLVAIMAGVEVKHPQTAYAGLQKSLHQEWDFV